MERKGEREGEGEGERGKERERVMMKERDYNVLLLFYILYFRKYTLLLNNIVIFIGVGLESLAVHPAMFIVGRFIVGVGAGKREGRKKRESERGREGGWILYHNISFRSMTTVLR